MNTDLFFFWKKKEMNCNNMSYFKTTNKSEKRDESLCFRVVVVVCLALTFLFPR